jgi:GAF domain-containing protein
MRPGDKVKFIHETREGIIARVISDTMIAVRVEGGTEIDVMRKNVVALADHARSAGSYTGTSEVVLRLQKLGELAHALATGQISEHDLEVNGEDEVGRVERSLREIAFNLEIQRRQQNALYAATKVIAKAENLTDAMPEILRAICESLGWQWSAMWTIDREAGVLRCGGIWQAPLAHVEEFTRLSREYSFPKGIGLPGRVWAQGKPAWVSDVQADENFPRLPTARKVGLHGALCFPIHGSHGTLGVMEFLTIEQEEPDNSLLAMMNAVGSQIGQFIERKLAQEMSAKKIAELEGMHRRLEKDFSLRMEASLRINAQHAATRVLADAPGLSEATPLLLQAICEGLDWQCSLMWAVNEDETALEFVDCWHTDDGNFNDFLAMSKSMNFTRGTGLPGRVWNNGEPLWILDVVKDSNFPRAKTAEKGDLHGAFAFPVRLKDRVLGVMEFFSRKVQEPDEALLAMMAAVGSQIGQFIERKNAEMKAGIYLNEIETQKRLVEHQKLKVEQDYAKRVEDSRRLQAQHSATKVLADAPGLSEATPMLLKSICEGLNWQCSMMWAVNEDETALEFVDCWHSEDGDFDDFLNMSRSMSFTRGRGLPGRVWDNGEPLWILDVVKDTNFPRAKTAEKGDLHGAFAFPVRLGDHVSCVMEFFSRKVQSPDEALLEMMDAVGSQIGQFIERKNAEARSRIYLAEVEKQKNLIEEHQKEIIDSINYARRIQHALLANEERMGWTAVLSALILQTIN